MRFLHVKMWCIHSFKEKMIEISLIPLANPTTGMNKYPSKKGTSPFWMHMVSFFGKRCKPFRVPQKKKDWKLNMSAKILHSKRWFLHSEWRTEISPFRTEISPFRTEISPFRTEISPFRMEIYPFRMEIYPFRTGRFLHSEWRFPHFSILNGEKKWKKNIT